MFFYITIAVGILRYPEVFINPGILPALPWENTVPMPISQYGSVIQMFSWIAETQLLIA
jgi:hypothetical protein